MFVESQNESGAALMRLHDLSSSTHHTPLHLLVNMYVSRLPCAPDLSQQN